MSKERKETCDVIPLTAAGWRDQRLIAAELRRLREKAGLTQEAIAQKLGVSQANISKALNRALKNLKKILNPEKSS